MTAHAWTNDDAINPWRCVEVTDDNGPRTIIANVGVCSRCGLVGAREDRRDGVSAYGLDLDSLAVMRSAPRCDGERDASAGT